MMMMMTLSFCPSVSFNNNGRNGSCLTWLATRVGVNSVFAIQFQFRKLISIPIQFRSGTKSLRQFNSNDGNSTPIPVNSIIQRQRLYHVIVIYAGYSLHPYVMDRDGWSGKSLIINTLLPFTHLRLITYKI